MSDNKSDELDENVTQKSQGKERQNGFIERKKNKQTFKKNLIFKVVSTLRIKFRSEKSF